MTVYIVNFVVNMLLGLFLTHIKTRSEKRKYEKLYLLITVLQFGLVCGFRATSVGWDTAAYSTIFNHTPDTWEHIFNNKQHIEIGFSVFCSIIKILGGNYQTMFIISSLFVMSSACIFIYRHSKDIVISVFILISFPFYYSSFDIIRHFMATAFFLLGYKYVVERKFVKYVIFLAIGSLFHTIAWLFLPFYFVRKIKWNGLTLALAGIATAVCFFFLDDIAVILATLINKTVPKMWVGSYGGGVRTAIMYLVVLIISIFAFYNQRETGESKSNALNLITILFIFSVIFINARIMTRLMMTTVPLMAIAIPELVSDKKNIKSYDNNTVYTLGIIAIGCFYHGFMLWMSWQNVVPYVPYWA
ncbi:MAG: EpsG family protein [Ruminococcaceae bacterium]|nr:EpsG family protein [Oscillospiraceae bacterium]MBE6671693.1 EpsG family protein [Oscillospiraceae bacterium]